jgi:hypothetical protein
MKFLFILTLFFTPFGSHIDLDRLSVEFFEASTDKSKREAFLFQFEQNKATSATILAYHGAALALMAEVKSNPYTKLNHFIDGKHMIEKAIALDRMNPELRYVRFMIQANTPAFLDYRGDILEDYQAIFRFKSNSPIIPTWLKNFNWYIDKKGAEIPEINIKSQI